MGEAQKTETQVDCEAKARNLRRAGAIATAVWIGVGAYWALSTGNRFVELWWGDFNHVGDFLAGFFAPLAFLWLVIGYMQQGLELRMQREELRLQRIETARLAEQAEKQASAVRDNELHTRKDMFFRAAPIYEAQINSLCSEALQLAGWDINSLKELWANLSSGDRFIFMRRFSGSYGDGRSIERIYDLRNPNRIEAFTKLTSALDNLFGEYCKEVRKSDPSGALYSVMERIMLTEFRQAIGKTVQGIRSKQGS